MSAPPFLQLFPSDYLRDTGRLTTLQHGAYFLLIMDYWVNGGLPDDDEQLAAITRLTEDQWGKIRPVLARFFSEGWVHLRIERDLAKAQEKTSRRSTAGKAGAEARHALGKQDGNASDHSIAAGNATSNGQASSPDIQKDTSLRSVSGAKPRKPKSTKSAIAEDAQPTLNDRDHALKIGMSVEAMRIQWPKFRDHHLANDSRFANWSAAWRTWCAKWVEWGGNKTRAGPAFKSADGIDEARQMIRNRANGRDHDEESDRGARTGHAGNGSLDLGHAEQARGGRLDEEWDGPMLDLSPERPH